MSHAVETMAYTNDVPWHGLGEYVADAPDVDAMLKVAGLDWEVERRPIFTNHHEESHYDDPDFVPSKDEFGVFDRIDGFAALTRSSDNKVLDIVGSRYTPVQNRAAFEFFREFTEAGQATMETAGSLRGGRYVWGLASLGQSFTMRGNDRVNGYLLVASPHEQGKSLIIKFTTVRVVCNNTLTLALSAGNQGEWRMSHRTALDGVKIEEAKEALGIAREQLGEFEKLMRSLQKIKLTQKDAIDVLAPVFQPKAKIDHLKADPDENLSPRMKQLFDINNRAPGAQPDNAWGLLNAVTYYTDHVASRTDDKRLTNAWLGRTAVQKERVMHRLEAMV